MQKKQADRESSRERERRARGRRKYGQAKLKHAKKGIISCGIAALTFFSLASSLVVTYVSGGSTGILIGIVGILTMILSGFGAYCAYRGFREREKDYLTCKIGMGCNIFFLLSLISIFCRGLF